MIKKAADYITIHFNRIVGEKERNEIGNTMYDLKKTNYLVKQVDKSCIRIYLSEGESASQLIGILDKELNKLYSEREFSVIGVGSEIEYH